MAGPEQDRLSTASVEACRLRLGRLRSALTAKSLEALIVSNPTDIRYLTSFNGEDSLLVVWPDGATIVSDPRHEEFLEPWSASGLTDVIMGTRHQLERALKALATDAGLARLGVQADELTIATRRRLASGVGDIKLIDTEGILARLRLIKDDLEVTAIERAASIHQQAARNALGRLHEGMTELELCALIEYEMKTHGASGPSFGTMVATGPRSSVIHHQTGAAPIGEGPLLIDWGAVVDGYCSDMTRTFAVGSLPEKIGEIYQIVYDAQQEAIAACEPGRDSQPSTMSPAPPEPGSRPTH